MATHPHSATESEVALPRAGSGQMFDAIAQRYDLLNRLISLGVDQRWRRRTVEALRLQADAEVLDVATGTADLALLTTRLHGDARVVGLDPSRKMLEVGREKVERAGLTQRIELLEGDAQALPFEPERFDGITMAFGIRNVPDRALALTQMQRVLKPGAHVTILELSEPKSGLLAAGARFHMHTVVPWLGGLLSGSREYRYLPQSIAAFPPPEEFAELMRRSGLEVIAVEPLTFGVCHLYVGRRPGGSA